MAAATMTPPTPMPSFFASTTTTTAIPAKRPKAPKKDDSGEDESSRAGKRGRPRVESRDQSAVERRRTQIRLAQRAYRERKEVTISELETSVTQLQDSLQLIYNEVSNFQSIAVQAGLATWDPSVALTLQNTVHKVTQLAAASGRLSRADSSETALSLPPRHDKLVRKRVHSLDRSSQGPRKIDGTVHRENWLPKVSPPTVEGTPWGYEISHEDEQVIDIEQGKPDTATTTDNYCTAWLDSAASDTIARASEPVFTDAWLSSAPSLPKELKPHTSYDMPEISWARRFHRSCYEGMYRVLTNPQTPPEVIYRKLKYSLSFRSIEGIAKRIHEKLTSQRYDPMEVWDVPVLHIGNSGHNYPRTGMDSTTEPPQGFAAERNVGPWPLPDVENVAPAHMYPYQVAQWLGIEGTWFDGYDTEQYLRTKGIWLDGWSSHAVVEIDATGRPLADASARVAANAKTDTNPFDSVSPNEGTMALSHDSPQSLPTSSDEGCAELFKPTIDAAMTGLATTTFATESHVNFEFSILDAVAEEPSSVLVESNAGHDGTPTRRQVIIDVDKFIQALQSHTLCLGRSPGIKQDHVDLVLQAMISEALEQV